MTACTCHSRNAVAVMASRTTEWMKPARWADPAHLEFSSGWIFGFRVVPMNGPAPLSSASARLFRMIWRTFPI